MPTFPPPYAKVLVSRNSGPFQSGGIVAQGGDTIALAAESTVSWKANRWEIYSYPPGWSAPAGWVTDTTGVIFSVALTPPAFTLPSLPSFGKWLFALRINEALTNDELDIPPLSDRTTGLSVLSPNNLRDTGALEEQQFDAIASFIGDIQRNWRIIDAVLSGFTPIGTLTPGPANTVFVNNGTGTAVVNTKIVDANVDPTAAIAGTKISPNFGSQSIVTTGTATFGSTTVSGLTLGSLTGILVASAGTVSSVTGADTRIPFWSSDTLTTDAGLTFGSSTLSATNVTVATNLTLTALAGTDGPLQVVGGVVGVGPAGANSAVPIIVASRTALALVETGSMRTGWQATTQSPLERWVLVTSDTVVDSNTRVAAKNGGGTNGNWILEIN